MSQKIKTLKRISSKVLKKNADKPVFSPGSIKGRDVKALKLPPVGKIYRYILTSVQNNTLIHDVVWSSLQALAKHYDAKIFIGTYSYNQNAYGRLAVKQGKQTSDYGNRELWFDDKISGENPDGMPYLQDERIQLADGLVWCGEMNILPTDVNPLRGLESYSHRQSAIFPHAKMAMRSVATMQGKGTKLNFTTGTITRRNYIQKRAGLVAEFHHVYGAVLVEVNSNGNWWVRQLNASNDGTIYDLDIKVSGNKITTGNSVEAITWGDLHATKVDEKILKVSLDMLDTLKPKFQFLHDVLEGASINRHQVKSKCPHYAFHRWIRGLHRVDEELLRSAAVINKFVRPWSKVIAPDANHDGWWLKSWLAKYDYRLDPANSELFLDLQRFFYEKIRSGLMPKDVNIMQEALGKFGVKDVKFLLPDESFIISNIECGMHGHLGPNGAKGSPANLSKMGHKANIGHTHVAGIYDGVYVAGTMAELKWDYTYGPSSWSHSHIVTYPNGKRTIITIYAGDWRA